METLRGDNSPLAAPELLQAEGGNGIDSGRVTPGSSRFTTWALNRLRQGKNCLIVITGELGIGKSYMGLKLCRYFDPNFNVDKVVFLSSDFMRMVQTSPYGSWVLFDEPNLAIGHRTFMTLVNDTVAKFVQASRFTGVNAIFALPSADLMDTAVVRVAHARIHVTDRGYGKVELIRHNQYQGGVRIRFPRLCTIRVNLPDAELTRLYEAKRKDFHSTFFNAENLAKAEHGAIAPPRKMDEDYIREVLGDPEAFKVNGKLSTGKISALFNLNQSKASNIKVRAQYLLIKKQPIIQS